MNAVCMDVCIYIHVTRGHVCASRSSGPFLRSFASRGRENRVLVTRRHRDNGRLSTRLRFFVPGMQDAFLFH